VPDLRAGNYITIRGVGRRFGGTYRVRKVTHRIDGTGFTTDFSITQSGHSSLLGLVREHVADQPSPHKAEKFYGVVLAEVTANDERRAIPRRNATGAVQVSYPGLSDTFTSGWAPGVRPMAGRDAGFYAVPDVGDQVLVAFEHGDLSQPYVLGALWTATQKPPVSDPDGTNSKRVLRSKAGHTITFDDTQNAAKLTIEDKLGSTITLDASNGSLTIHAAQNLVLTSDGGIRLEAFKGATKIAISETQVDIT
jgi:phage baseplate assembly protein V